MFCRNCGNELKETMLYCPKCGTAVGSSLTQNKNGKVKSKGKAGKKRILFVLPLVAVALVVLIIVFSKVSSFRYEMTLRTANKFLEKQKYEDAIEAYGQALEWMDDSREAKRGLKKSYLAFAAELYENTEFEDALKYYKYVLKEDAQNSDALEGSINCYLKMAKINYNAQQYEKAMQYYEMVLENDSNNVDAITGRDLCYLKISAGNMNLYNEEMVHEQSEQENQKTGENSVTINVYRPCFNLYPPDAAQVQKVQDAVNAYIADKINVQVNVTEIASGDYTGTANLALANNEINLLWTASWESTIGTNDLVPANAVYDITDLLAGSTLYSSMDAGQWEATKYNGKNYFIPVYMDNVEGYDLMARKALVDKYGWDLSSVKKLADIEPMLADCKAEGLKYPYLTRKTAMFYRWYINDFDFFTADSTANWVAVDKKTNEVVNVIQTPQYKEFCDLMAKWAEAGYISEDDVTKTTTDTTTQSQDWGFSWWTDIPVNDEANSRYGQDVVMQPITDRWAHSTSALGSCYCVTSNSSAEQAKACIDFMGLLYTDSKLADMWTFGIEGEDFDYVDGKVSQHSEKYNHGMWESASATVVTPLDVEPDNKADLYKTFNGGAKTSPAAGFRFDKAPVEAQFTACQNVFEEYGFILENGGVASGSVDSTIAAYQAALDAAGYQDVIAEFQRQYDYWKVYVQ